MISRSTYLGKRAAIDQLLFGVENHLAVLAHRGLLALPKAREEAPQ